MTGASYPSTRGQPQVHDAIYGVLSLKNLQTPQVAKIRCSGASHRAPPPPPPILLERGRPCPAGCRESAVRSIELSCSLGPGRTESVCTVGRCWCLAVGNVYRSCDVFNPSLREREKSSSRISRRTTCGQRAPDRASRPVVASFDGVAVEDLNIAGLLRSRRYSKKMSEQRWGAFDRVLGHKAEKAGVPYVRVSPSHTSTDCSRCGHRQAMPLGTRVYRCGSCRLSLCRDVNAAKNIRARAFPQVRGREGLPPGAARYTNNHSETDSPLGAETQVVAAEQHA